MEHPFFKTEKDLIEYQKKSIKELNDKRTRNGKLVKYCIEELDKGLTEKEKKNWRKAYLKNLDKLIRGY